MSYQIVITDAATPALKGIDDAIKGTGVREVIGRAAVNVTRKFYFAKPPNKSGFPSTGFWAQCARGTNFQVLPEGVNLSVHQVGINQRLHGGTIKPKNAKYLTIPAIAEAYGHRASEFPNLAVFWGKDKSGTVRPMGLKSHADYGHTRTIKSGKKAGQQVFVKENKADIGSVYFWFVKSVTQKADPDAIPPQADLEREIVRNVSSYLSRVMKRGGNN